MIEGEKTWNKEIVRAGRRMIQKQGGWCKEWVFNLIVATCGITPPRNHPTDKWMWEKEHDFIASRPLEQTTPVSEGDILQILWHKDMVNQEYHWHTAIFIQKEMGQVTLLDSNWKGKKRVTEHKVKSTWFDEALDKGTVYTVLKQPKKSGVV